jgi:hypothetical protein
MIAGNFLLSPLYIIVHAVSKTHTIYLNVQAYLLLNNPIYPFVTSIQEIEKMHSSSPLSLL